MKKCATQVTAGRGTSSEKICFLSVLSEYKTIIYMYDETSPNNLLTMPEQQRSLSNFGEHLNNLLKPMKFPDKVIST